MLGPMKKRARSPSPSPDMDLTSPLEVLMKRRKKRDYFDDSPAEFSPSYNPDEAYHSDGESSMNWNRLQEKRRTKQWERQNAPQGLPIRRPLEAHQRSYSSSYTPHQTSYSQPLPNAHHLSPLYPKQPHLSQPNAKAGPMSSSPVRHVLPTSSPFHPSQGDETRMEAMELMDEEEMKREWGEDYAAQNSILHNLHMTRVAASVAASDTPDQSLLQTPTVASPSSAESSQNLPEYHQTPSHPMLTPFASTPYRNPYFPSSPLSRSPVFTPHTIGNDIVDLDEPDLAYPEGDEEVKRRYEEANKLLAELEVHRRSRWGDEPRFEHR